MNLPFNFDRALEGLSKITLKGGVVAKVTFAVVAVSLALTMIAWSVANIWLSAAALFFVFTLSFTMLWRLVSFADRHPQAALLEGAEFLVHEQIVHSSKSMPVIPLDQSIPIQPELIEGAAANPEIAQQPDQDTQALESNGGAR